MALARHSVGYLPPPAASPSPSDTEIAGFPRSLRYLKVSGVGSSVTQSVYVGREDRVAKQGRFGNYFSHVVIATDGSLIGDGRNPITTWESPSWQTDASPGDPGVISQLAGGSVTLAAAESLLDDAIRHSWFVVLHDWLADVLADRTRIVILDDAEHAWAWIAAVALTLPSHLAPEITFDTYSAEPDASSARIVVAPPETDRLALGRRELTGELHVIDAQRPGPEPRRLLARSMRGGQRWNSAMSGFLSLDELALALSVAGDSPVDLEADDLPAAVQVMNTWLAGGEPTPGFLDSAAMRINAALDLDVSTDRIDGAALEELWRIIAVRATGVSDSVQIVALRLALRTPDLALAAPSLPSIHEAITSADLIGDAITLITQDSDVSAEMRARLALLARVKAVGYNSGLDRRIGRASARLLDESDIADWLTGLAGRVDGKTVVESVLRQISDEGEFSERRLAFLTDPTVARIHAPMAGRGDDFPLTYARAVGLAWARPEQRGRALEWALRLAETPVQSDQLIDALYGERQRPAEFREVLAVLGTLSRRPGQRRIAQGWAMLEDQDPFSDDPAVRQLARDLNAIDQSGARRSVYLAIALDGQREKLPPGDWIRQVAKWERTLSQDHLRGLLVREVSAIDKGRLTREDHCELVSSGVRELGDVFSDAYWDQMGRILRDITRTHIAVEMVVAWSSKQVSEPFRSDAVDVRFAKALGIWSEGARADVGDALGRDYGRRAQEFWTDWSEQNPANGAVGRQVRRIFGRRPHE